MNISERNRLRSKPKLLTVIKNKMRVSSYSPKTIETYALWIKDFVRFNNMKHPNELGKIEVEKYLNYLAVERNIKTLIL